MIWTLFGQFFDATVGQMVNAMGGPQPMNRSSPWRDASRGARPAPPPAPGAGGSSTPSSIAAWQPAGGGTGASAAIVERQESRTASPKDLDDDAIKLVKYALVSIRRCHEKVLIGGVILVTTRMTSASFSPWIVALYLQSPEYRAAVARDRGNEITHDDKKFLRVSWGVLTRWPRQSKSGCGTKKLDALKGIRDALAGFRLPPPARHAPPAPAETPVEVAPAEGTLSTAGEIPAQGTVPAAEPSASPATRPPRRPRPRVSAPALEEPPPPPEPRTRRRRPGPPRRRPR